MSYKWHSLLIFLTLALWTTDGLSTGKSQMSQEKDTIKYLALGDSYTIGESVEEDQRWPVQLTAQLNASGFMVQSPRIIATTGWTTDELQAAIATAEFTADYDLVSLLIGVNNQYRDYPFDQYIKEFETLLDVAIAKAGNDADKVFVVSIPDYGVTPFGQKMDPVKIDRELQQYNQKAREIAGRKGVIFINITDLSKKALDDPDLVAEDGLHPSGAMYSEWVERIFPEVKSLLE